MTRVRRVFVSMMALALGAALATAAVAQAPQGAQRGFGGGLSRGSLLGLLRIDNVQEELKLSDEVVAKVTELRETLAAEMREQFAALRDITNRQERQTKRTELSTEFDRKAREQLREVLSQEQMMRLYQVRMQVRPVVDSLANRWVAGRLQLTDEQQQKVAQIVKDAAAKQAELRGDTRDTTDEQRREVFQKRRTIRSDADEKALGLLSAEQKESFEEMKGEKIELPTRRGRRQTS
jgi:hypothetical protein